MRQKLKEKDTLLRISKFKLNEVTRNIKHGQLKPLDKKDDRSTSPTTFIPGIDLVTKNIDLAKPPIAGGK